MPRTKLQDDLKKRNPFESPQQEAVISILRTNELFQYRFGQLFRSHGLTQPQYNILRILRGAGDRLPALEIADRMIAVVPSITNLVNKLERAGWVERERCDEDRRVCYVRITRAGRALLKKLDQPNLAMHDALVGHLGERELQQLAKLLEKARRSAEQDLD